MAHILLKDMHKQTQHECTAKFEDADLTDVSKLNHKAKGYQIMHLEFIINYQFKENTDKLIRMCVCVDKLKDTHAHTHTHAR